MKKYIFAETFEDITGVPFYDELIVEEAQEQEQPEEE